MPARLSPVSKGHVAAVLCWSLVLLVSQTNKTDELRHQSLTQWPGTASKGVAAKAKDLSLISRTRMERTDSQKPVFSIPHEYCDMWIPIYTHTK